MRRARIVAKEGVSQKVETVRFMLMASEEALRFATKVMTDEESRQYEQSPGPMVQTAYFEGLRDAYLVMSKLLLRREMYDTDDVSVPVVNDTAIASGYVTLPIPAPR